MFGEKADVVFLLGTPGADDLAWKLYGKKLDKDAEDQMRREHFEATKSHYNSLRDQLEQYGVTLVAVSTGYILSDRRFEEGADHTNIASRAVEGSKASNFSASLIAYIDYGDEPSSGGQIMYFFEGEADKLLKSISEKEDIRPLSSAELYLIEADNVIKITKETLPRLLTRQLSFGDMGVEKGRDPSRDLPAG